MPGTAAGWGGGGGRGRPGRWEEGQRIELAKPHGKNWICFHSSSNKQQGNFASAHLRLNTFQLWGIWDRQFSSRESAVMSKISAGKHSPSPASWCLRCSIKGLHWPSIYSPRHLCLDSNFWTSRRRKQRGYRSGWKRKIGLEFAVFKLAQSTSRFHQILVCPNPTLNVKIPTLKLFSWKTCVSI